MPLDIPAWVGEAVFYLIFPDRFASSSKIRKPPSLEAWEHAPTTYGFKGGDLLGIAERLDYLEELGVNTILLNPIFSSSANHRYHTSNYFEVDPILGGNAAFAALVRGAHARRMRVVLDGVFNHTGRGFYQFTHTLENGIQSPYLNWFHFNLDWLKQGRPLNAFPPEPTGLPSYDDTFSLNTFGYKSWWNLPALPKLNTQNREVREFLFEVARYWINQGADGWRLDVPSEIDDDAFWQEFRGAVKGANPEAYIVGEIWEGAARWLKGDQFDAVMNYALTKKLLGFIAGDSLDVGLLRQRSGLHQVERLSAQEFQKDVEQLLGAYPAEVTRAQLNLLGSHDTPRFLTMVRNNLEVVKLAFLFLFTYPGAPCIYYGDEIGLSGGHDPDCRQGFPWQADHWNQQLHSRVKELIRIRKDHPALRHGSYETLLAQDDVYAYRRKSTEEELVVALNRSNAVRKITLELKDSTAKIYLSLLDSRNIPVQSPSNMELEIPPFSGLLLQKR